MKKITLMYLPQANRKIAEDLALHFPGIKIRKRGNDEDGTIELKKSMYAHVLMTVGSKQKENKTLVYITSGSSPWTVMFSFIFNIIYRSERKKFYHEVISLIEREYKNLMV